jgi:tRNA pseudouridine65 synthase
VKATLLTGRRHQIRRHLKHVGCPLVGDTTYGRSEHNRYFRERFGLDRLALHAEELVVAGLVLRAPLPSDLLRASAWPDV